MQGPGADVLIKHVSHLVETLVCDGHPSSRQLLLAQAGGMGQVRDRGSGGMCPLPQHTQVPCLRNGSVELLYLVPQLLGLLLHGCTLLLQHGDVLGRLLQGACLANLWVSPVWAPRCGPTPGPMEALGFGLGEGAHEGTPWLWGCQPVLAAHLEAGLDAERAHQPVQGVKSQFDVEAPLLLCRDVCDAPVLSLVGAESGVSLGRSVGGTGGSQRILGRREGATLLLS